jgi:hypothetical protein
MFSQAASLIPTPIFAQVDPGRWGVGVFLTIMFLLIGVCPLVWVIGSTWAGVARLRLQAGLKQQVIALKQQMVERGMSAEEIVQVLGPPAGAADALLEPPGHEAAVLREPCAGEVLVDQAGQWVRALVVGRDGDRYLIHTCPGYYEVETSSDEWVDGRRIRFPAPAAGQDGSSRDPADGTPGFGAGSWYGAPKKDPVPAEV